MSCPQALQLFHLSQEHYVQMLELRRTRRTEREAACSWLRANEATWQMWRTTRRPSILIGGIFPIAGKNYEAKGVIPGGRLGSRADGGKRG